MRFFYKLLLRLRSLVRRRGIEAELSDELRFHLEQQMEAKKAEGLSPEEARYAAQRELGGLEQIKEECRDMRRVNHIENLMQDLRYALRMLRKSPGFTAVAVLTLAFGIGANTAMFSLIDAVMLRLLPVSKPEELLQVKRFNPRWGEASPSFTNPIWEQIRDQQDVFSRAFAWGSDNLDLGQGGAVHMATTVWVSGGFFDALGVAPAAGRLIGVSDDQRGCPAVAVLSYGFWQDHFGGVQSVIGGTLSLDGHPFQVIGVAPAGFFGMDVGDKFDVAAPICATVVVDGEKSRLGQRSWWWLSVAGRIKPGVSSSQLSARLKVLSQGILTASVPRDWSPQGQKNFIQQTLTADSAATGMSRLRRQFEQPLRVLMGVVGLVLLIACANIASLMLARTAFRHKEIAVRQALGASRGRLIRQLLTECILLSSGGALFGILFARWGTALLVRYISTSRNAIFLDLSFDGRVLGFTVAIAALTAVLFGLLPALRSTRVSLMSAMKGGSHALELEQPARLRGRRWIVASQIALSLVLLVAAGLLLRSFAKLATLDIGFDRTNVILVAANLKTAKIPPERQGATYEQIEDRLRGLPAVLSVGRSVMTPLSGGAWNNSIRTEWSKAVTGDDVLAWFNYVSPGFLGTLRMDFMAGRNFNTGDTATAPAIAIVNQTLARRFFPGLNPIGKTFRIDDHAGNPGPPIEVVGIVRDAKYASLRDEIHATAFFPETQAPGHTENETFEVRTAMAPSALSGPVQAAIAGVNKGIPLEIHTLTELANDSIIQERLLALLSGFFGALALLLAMIGLYGTLSYLVTQRRTEFGIRMALGAQGGSILRLVMRDVIAILVGGLVAGICLSLATTRWLQQMLFGLGARDALTMGGAAALLSVVALVAGFLPARRATKVDPMVALRCE